MRILFDHNTPAPLRYSLNNYTVATTAECGWDRLTNGKLLDAAEKAGFDILLTDMRSGKIAQADPLSDPLSDVRPSAPQKAPVGCGDRVCLAQRPGVPGPYWSSPFDAKAKVPATRLPEER
jgi:hypothetical protein